MKTYIGTKQIEAEPASKEGQDGYKVIYPDGYESWSPKGVFEDAYCGNGEMNLGHAILCLQQGKRVSRSGWNGKGLWLELQLPDENSKMTLPYIYLNYPNDSEHTPGALVPWLASQTDALATDWGVVA